MRGATIMDEREKNAEIIRTVVAQADTDGIDRFMSQYSRVAVCEWLIAQMPTEARRIFLRSTMATYATELSDAGAS